MPNDNNKMIFNPLRNLNQLWALLTIIAVVMLLFLRDALAVSINKWIFCIIVIPYLLFADEDDALIVWSFCMPLYVGLPGNFFTVALLTKLILDRRHKMVVTHRGAFLITAFLMAFMFFQNCYLQFYGVYNMMCIAELLLVYIIIYKENKAFIPHAVIAYSVGVAFVGIVMLVSTLQHVSFSSLLNVSSRLGDYRYSEGMSIVIDPNFYGLYAITSLSCVWLFIQSRMLSRRQTVIALLSISASLCVAFIGLSRGFILCCALWTLLVFILDRDIGNKGKVALLFTTACLTAYYCFPNVLNSLLQRFGASDMNTGNGRTTLLMKFGEAWSETIGTVLFGIGLFVSEAHCMQAQFLFGIGIVGCIPLFILGIIYFKDSIRFRSESVKALLIPIIIVQVSSAMLPAARSLSTMMPVILGFLVAQSVCIGKRNIDVEVEL